MMSDAVSPQGIAEGDHFAYMNKDGDLRRFQRIQDDPSPEFECERIRVTHLSSSMSKFEPYTFAAEPEWFARRGLKVVL